MKKSFAGFYTPSEEEFAALWNNATFMLDSSVLLSLYRYSEDTRKILLDIMTSLADRLWVPHQAALEYHRNRLSVISTQSAAYSQVMKILEKAHQDVNASLSQYRRHPFINVDNISTEIETKCAELTDGLKQQEGAHPNLITNDTIRNSITELLDTKIGKPYSDTKLNTIYQEGEKRYQKKTPPGYMDTGKPTEQKFGDLVLWFQIMDKVKEVHSPAILVIDDKKEDWWWIFGGKTVGPRPELVQEMHEDAGMAFYMYTSDRFLSYAANYLKRHVARRAIDEIKYVRRRESHLSDLLVAAQRQRQVMMDRLLELAHVNAERVMEFKQLELEASRAGQRIGDIPQSFQDRLALLRNEIYKTEDERRDLSLRINAANELLHNRLDHE